MSVERYSLASWWSLRYAKNIAAAVTRAAAPAAAAIGTGRHHQRRPRSRAGATWSTTRLSNPTGGSCRGASTRSSSATSESSSMKRRQSEQRARCSSALARSSPSAMPRASSGASSRNSVQPLLPLIACLQVGAELQKRGADPGLGGAERRVLHLADLPRGEPEQSGKDERPSLLFGQGCDSVMHVPTLDHPATALIAPAGV